jgi:hypothetical protein
MLQVVQTDSYSFVYIITAQQGAQIKILSQNIRQFGPDSSRLPAEGKSAALPLHYTPLFYVEPCALSLSDPARCDRRDVPIKTFLISCFT